MKMYSFTTTFMTHMSDKYFSRGEIVTVEPMTATPITIDNYDRIPAFGEDLLD